MPVSCDVLLALGAQGAAVTGDELEGLDAHGAGVLAGPEELEGTLGIVESFCFVVVGMPVGETCNAEVSISACG